MKNKYCFITVLLACILLISIGLTTLYVNQTRQGEQKDEFCVVTSFYPMYVIAENIIGDSPQVRLESLSEPQTGCLHDYQPTSEDMKLLATADVFIVNGGGIEAFLEDIAKEYPNLMIINACEDLNLLEENAHAWMSITNYQIQVRTIADGLIQADPEHQEVYQGNEESYLLQLEPLQKSFEELAAKTEGQSLVIFHEAYEYLAEELNMHVAGTMDLDEERQVSAGEVAEILKDIEENQISVIFAEELYGKNMGDMIEKEAGVEVLYLDTLVRGNGEKDSYVTGMKKNIELIENTLENICLKK